jgi:hypothetical protein
MGKIEASGLRLKVIEQSKRIKIDSSEDKVLVFQKVKERAFREYGQKGAKKRKMGRGEMKGILAELDIRSEEIEDKEMSEKVRKLLQLVERVGSENEEWRAENQELKDAMNILKGEQGKPKVKGNKKADDKGGDDKGGEDKGGGDGDVSSEVDRKSRKPPSKKKSKAKKHKITIDHTEFCEVDKSSLPEDAKFKDYRSVIVQEIIIKTNNIEYKKEIYYSVSENKTYSGQLPLGVEGEFGSGIKALVYTQKHIANMSEPKIKEFLENMGIYISAATISRILTKNNALFHQEKADIVQAGLASGSYQQIDDTGARVKGENQYVQIISNPYYAAYFTVPHKDRLSVLAILNGGQLPNYLFNEQAFTLLEGFALSKKLRLQLQELALDKTFDEPQMEAILQQLYPHPHQGKNNRRRIKEAGAIAAYHHQTDFPVIELLLADDAPQFKLLTKFLALCWIHEGRHFKKLRPVIPWHQDLLDNFRKQFWDYYHQLLAFKANPSASLADQLAAEFDILFATKTGYAALDDRIAKTYAKKVNLLMVLSFPQLPLHNNASELEARVQARKRDVSLHTMSHDGTRANDTFLTIVRTAKKLGVNPYLYIYDRVSKQFLFPSLADLIKDKSLLNEGFFLTS